MLKKLVLLLGLLALCAEVSAQARSDADLKPGTIKGLPVKFIPMMKQVCASMTTRPFNADNITVIGTNNCNFKVQFFGMQPGLAPIKRGWGSAHNPLIDIASWMRVGETHQLGHVAANVGPLLDFYCQSGPPNSTDDWKNKYGKFASPQLDGDPRTPNARCFIWWDHAP